MKPPYRSVAHPSLRCDPSGRDLGPYIHESLSMRLMDMTRCTAGRPRRSHMSTRPIIRATLAALLVAAVAGCGTDAPDGAGVGGAAGAAQSGRSGGAGTDRSRGFARRQRRVRGDRVRVRAVDRDGNRRDLWGTLVNNGTIEHDIKFDNGDAIVAAPARPSSSSSRCPWRASGTSARSPGTPMPA